MNKIEIQVDDRGYGTIILDGRKLNDVRAVSFQCEAKGLATVTLTLVNRAVEVKADADVRVREE